MVLLCLKLWLFLLQVAVMYSQIKSKFTETIVYFEIGSSFKLIYKIKLYNPKNIYNHVDNIILVTNFKT